MRFDHTFIALSLIAAQSPVGTARQDKGPDAMPVQERVPASGPWRSR